MKNLKISKHLMLRYVERFTRNKEILLSLKTTLWNRTFQQKKAIRLLQQEIRDIWNECKETKSHMNNTSALIYFYETYGFEKNFRFFHNHEVMFITVQDDNNLLQGITCYSIKQNTILNC